MPKKLMQKTRYKDYFKKQGRRVVAERVDPKKIFFTGVGDYRKQFADRVVQPVVTEAIPA